MHTNKKIICLIKSFNIDALLENNNIVYLNKLYRLNIIITNE